MNKESILMKRNPDEKDRQVIFLLSAIEKLHNRCSIKELERLNSLVCTMIRNHYPLEELVNSQNVNATSSVNGETPTASDINQEQDALCKNCGHHTNDHSYPYPEVEINDLECDKCDCKKFQLQEENEQGGKNDN